MKQLSFHIRCLLLNEFKLNHTAADAVRNICAHMGRNVLSYSIAKYWFRRFQQGNLSLEDRHRSGRPSTIDTQRLKAFIEANPKQTTRKLAKQLNTSHSTIERHLRGMGMQFTNNGWVYPKSTQESLSQSLSLKSQLSSSSSLSQISTKKEQNIEWYYGFV